MSYLCCMLDRRHAVSGTQAVCGPSQSSSYVPVFEECKWYQLLHVPFFMQRIRTLRYSETQNLWDYLFKVSNGSLESCVISSPHLSSPIQPALLNTICPSDNSWQFPAPVFTTASSCKSGQRSDKPIALFQPPF